MQAPFHVAPLIAALALLVGCSTAPSRSSGPPPATDRTFTVPVYANEPGRADATAKAECRRQGLHHKLLRNDGARMTYQCVNEAPTR